MYLPTEIGINAMNIIEIFYILKLIFTLYPSIYVFWYLSLALHSETKV